MESIPQSTMFNPVKKSDSKWFLGIPGISSISTGFSLTGIGLGTINDALVKNNSTGSYVLKGDELARSFTKDLSINASFNENWIFLGLPFKNGFFTFNVTERVKTRIAVPNDLFKLALQGNGGANLGTTFNFNFSADAIHFREYAVGYSKGFLGDRLRLGARVKYLYGLSVLNTERNDLTFYTKPENFTIRLASNIKFNMASSMIPLDDEGEFDVSKAFYGAKNTGWGFDLGASLDLSDKIELSAALLDMGSIKWTENTRNYKSINPAAFYDFTGIDLNDVFNDTTNIADALEHLGDSIIEAFDLDSSRGTFKTGLLTDFIIGGTYTLSKVHSFSAVSYFSIYNKQLYPSLSLAWNGRFGRVFSCSASYSLRKNDPYNIGLGMSLNALPFQFYFVSDNVLSAATGNVNDISLRLGFNLTFGRERNNPKPEKIKPDKKEKTKKVRSEKNLTKDGKSKSDSH